MMEYDHFESYGLETVMNLIERMEVSFQNDFTINTTISLKW